MDWDPNTPDGWTDEVQKWAWRPWTEDGVQLGWRKWGPCPRCHDTMAVYQEVMKGIDDGCGSGAGSYERIAAAEVS
jgi:hypothetical protein